MSLDQFVTTEQAANALGVIPNTIRTYCSNGTIPNAIKFGRDWLVPRDALQNIVFPSVGRPKMPSDTFPIIS